MYLRFGTIPIWPSRETVNKYMPESMRAKFPNVCVIIDCAEFKVETPSSLTLHKMMYSQYRHHTTVKSLLGIMPGGGFTFISPVFPGDTSDKEMVQKSWLLTLSSLVQRRWLDGRSRLYSS